MIKKVYFSLGSNLGNREGNVLRAIEMMKEQIGNCLCQSALLVTEPWGFESDNAFVNAAACFETSLEAMEVLRRTQEIERSLGRTTKSTDGGGYHDRPIDIDILIFGNETISTPELKVPHPLMKQRDFVMIPLREIIDKNDLEWLMRTVD